jgi:beta-lactamase regulating signal transducer with metallopeptidase domain
MSFVDWLEQPPGRLLTLVLLHFVWQGFAIALAVLFVVEISRFRAPAVRYACSLVGFFAMAICPIVTLIYLSVIQPPDAASGSLTTSESRILTVDGATAAQRWLKEGQPYVLGIWSAGVVLLGGRLLAGAMGVARLRRSRLPLPAKIADVVERLGKRLQMEALPLVFLSQEIAEAMAVGLIRPLVLIPAVWATEMPVGMLEAVIAHELAHLRRRDLWVNLLQRIVETLLFYHPAVWWLSHRLRIERELCADELAIAATGKRLEYARTLEQIASDKRAEIRPALAAFLRGETNMRLLERVRNVLGQPSAERTRIWPAGLLALALPLGLWAASAFNGPVVADDDRDEPRKPAVKRERDSDRKDRDRGDRGDRAREERREEKVFSSPDGKIIVTRKGDEPRERVETREERYVIIRDGEPPQEIVRRRVVDVDGKLLEERELGVNKGGGDRGDRSDRRIEELTGMVKRLTQQVERLQAEVSQLRGQKQGSKESPSREAPATRAKKWTGDDLDARKREVHQLAEKIAAAEAALAEREIDAARDAFAEKQKALAEMAAKLKGSEIEREMKDRQKEAAEQKRMAEERARGAREKAEAVRNKAEAERERKRRESDDEGEAKEKAARDKADAVKKQIQLKLQKLKDEKVPQEGIQLELTPKFNAERLGVDY